MFTAEPTAPLSFELFAPDTCPPALQERWARAYEESAKAAKPHDAEPAMASHEEPSLAHPHLTFPEGLYGFGSYHTFVLADLDGAAGLHALVAVDDLSVQLSVVDAALAVRGYPLAEARAAAGMSDEEVAVALVVVCPADGGPMTVNLRAPIVIGLTSHRGVQVIVDGDLPFSAAL